MTDPTRPAPGRFDGFVPERAPIEAYGNGGFRFAGMSHRGSLMALDDGMHAWVVGTPSVPSDLTAPLIALLARLEPPQFLLVGTGLKQIFLEPAVQAAFLAQRIGVEVMDTGAACRTYNVLLAEQRPVMAAWVAVP